MKKAYINGLGEYIANEDMQKGDMVELVRALPESEELSPEKRRIIATRIDTLKDQIEFLQSLMPTNWRD